jgi:hypothetical protein
MSQSSKWHIWDFHLHTPFSILNSDFGDAESPDTWEQYVTQITAKAQEKGEPKTAPQTDTAVLNQIEAFKQRNFGSKVL